MSLHQPSLQDRGSGVFCRAVAMWGGDPAWPLESRLELLQRVLCGVCRMASELGCLAVGRLVFLPRWTGSCCAYGAGGPRCGRGAQLPSIVQQLWTWWNRAWPLGRSESSRDEQRGCALSFSAHLMPVCLSCCFSHQPLHCSQAPKTCRTQGRSTNGATFIA